MNIICCRIKRIAFFLLCISIPSSSSFGQEINISNGNVFDGEPFLAQNHVNPQNMVVAWMGFVFGNGTGLTIKVKSTTDGGQTWSPAVIIPHQTQTFQSADPSMAFDQNGRVYLCYIDHSSNPDSGGVFVSRSVDNGLTWSNPVKVIDIYADGNKLPIDRPWLTVDPSGSKLFVTTKPAPTVAPPNRAYFISSFTGGMTWQNWRYVDSTGYLIGNVIAAPMATITYAGMSTIHLLYPSYLVSQSVFARFIHASSTDNGNTFSYHVAFSGGGGSVSNDSAKLAYKLISDPSDTNHLALIYPTSVNGNFDIFYIESMNGGLNWTSPVRVNDDAISNGKMQDLVWAAFDYDGDLAITWRDRRNGTGNGYADDTQIYFAFRDKDSTQFNPNIPLSDSLIAFNSILAQNGNDFMCSVLNNDTISAVWSDTRDGSLDVWFVKLNARTGIISSVQLINRQSNLVSITQPTSGEFHIQTLNNKKADSIRIYNSNGKEIFNQQPDHSETIVNLEFATHGIYIIHIEQNQQFQQVKVVR